MENKDQFIRVIAKSDMSELYKVKKKVDEFQAALEKASALADELADKRIEITLVTETRSIHRNSRIDLIRDVLSSFFCKSGKA